MSAKLPKTYGAVILTKTCRGNPAEGIEYKWDCNLDSNSILPGQCLVRLSYAPINPSDINVLEGTYVRKPPELPATVGMEGSGIIAFLPASNNVDCLDQCGSKLSVGDHVVAWPWNWGSWTEYAVIDTKNVRRIPKSIDLRTAAMMCVNPPTAYGLLESAKKGDWIIQNAANSGMGQAIIQIAKARGIHTVNIVRRPALEQELVDLGADVVVVYSGDRDKNEEAVKSEFLQAAAKVKERTEGAQIRLAINAVCGLSGELLAKCLAPGGLHLTYGVMSQEPMSVSGGQLLFKDITYKGWHLGKFRDQKEKYEEMWTWLVSAVEQGEVTRSAIDKIYTLQEAKAAVQHAFSSKRKGKVMFFCRRAQEIAI